MFTKYLPDCKCHRKMTFTINLRTFTRILKGGLYNLTKDCKGVVKNINFTKFVKTLKHDEKLVFTMPLHHVYMTCKVVFSCSAFCCQTVITTVTTDAQ